MVTQTNSATTTKTTATPRITRSSDMANAISIDTITSKATKRAGITHPGTVEEGAHAVITPGVSVRLFGVYCDRSYDRTFDIGDVVEVHSYNLSYFGRIVSISAKTITVSQEMKRTNKRMSLWEFNWRNRELDLDAAANANADTMMCI